MDLGRERLANQRFRRACRSGSGRVVATAGAPRLPSAYTEDEVMWAIGEAEIAIEGFWRSVDAHWVNLPAANSDADCKPEQLLRAQSFGFDVPASLITQDPDSLRAFASTHGPIICKALREGVVPSNGTRRLFHTEVLRDQDLASLTDLGPEPYLFQALVEKRYDLRITVIGDEALGCKIDSQSAPDARVDWRKGDISRLSHTRYQLPPSLADRCVKLTRSYGLRFAAIDLARRGDGEYTFFELNPNGQWAWIEHLTGLPLRAHLVDELVGEGRESRA